MSRYEFVFADADDTLFDFRRAERWALGEAFREAGIEMDGELFADYDEINRELWRRVERGETDQGRLKVERFRLLFERRPRGLDAEGFSRAYLGWLSRAAFLLPGAEEFCASLRGKARLAIVTNGIGEVQRGRLRASAIRDCVEALVISEEVGSSKPAAPIFERARELLGCPDKGRILMIGDSLGSDIRGGANFGIDTCWFNPTGSPNASDLRPTYEVRSLGELAAIL